ncbi:MAG: hypothetical protein ACI8TP_003645 [Acidimicrobiales bacterium]|jgi:hypothetical protein
MRPRPTCLLTGQQMRCGGDTVTDAERPGPRGPNADCELCAADRFTHWYYEDEHCWVADCEVCAVPMVVWNDHGTEPTDEVVEHMMLMLAQTAEARFGAGEWKTDRTMRQVPEHFHAHARDADWWSQRFRRPMSKYTGVGTTRVEHFHPGSS